MRRATTTGASVPTGSGAKCLSRCCCCCACVEWWEWGCALAPQLLHPQEPHHPLCAQPGHGWLHLPALHHHHPGDIFCPRELLPPAGLVGCDSWAEGPHPLGFHCHCLLSESPQCCHSSVCPPVSCWPCRCSQCFPVLLCALLWLLSSLLPATLHCCPLVPTALVLSCLFSVLTLSCSALALLARLLCCSWKQLPGKLCALLLLLLSSPCPSPLLILGTGSC